MQVLTREFVELARHIRRQLRQLGHEVPALSDPELVERLEALSLHTGNRALQQDVARLRTLVEPTSPLRIEQHAAGGVATSPAEQASPTGSDPAGDAGDDSTSRPRRYYRGVPLDD